MHNMKWQAQTEQITTYTRFFSLELRMTYNIIKLS